MFRYGLPETVTGQAFRCDDLAAGEQFSVGRVVQGRALVVEAVPGCIQPLSVGDHDIH